MLDSVQNPGDTAMDKMVKVSTFQELTFFGRQTNKEIEEKCQVVINSMMKRK